MASIRSSSSPLDSIRSFRDFRLIPASNNNLVPPASTNRQLPLLLLWQENDLIMIKVSPYNNPRSPVHPNIPTAQHPQYSKSSQPARPHTTPARSDRQPSSSADHLSNQLPYLNPISCNHIPRLLLHTIELPDKVCGSGLLENWNRPNNWACYFSSPVGCQSLDPGRNWKV